MPTLSLEMDESVATLVTNAFARSAELAKCSANFRDARVEK